MSLARVLIAAFLLLLLPHITAAAPVYPPELFLTGFGFHSEGHYSYGLLYLDERQGGVAMWSNDYGGYEPPYCHEYGCEAGYYSNSLYASSGEFGIANGSAEFTSGPFVSETPYPSWPDPSQPPDTFTTRFAAGGILTFTMNVVPLSDEATGPWPQVAVGPMQTIEFVGEMGAFEVTYYLGDDTGMGGSPGGGYTQIPITRWEMSREDADVLGLRRRRGAEGLTPTSPWWPTSQLTLWLDYHNRDTDDPDYREFPTYDEFDATVVPEPALVGLVLLGVGASLRRWQRRGRRASGRISPTDRTGSPID